MHLIPTISDAVSTTGNRLSLRIQTALITFICRQWVICQLTNPQVACQCFSVIKWKCDNPTQMFIAQLALWQWVFLSGFYWICIFFSFFTTFLDRKSCSRVFFSFFSSDIPGFTAPALETLFILVQLMLTQHSNQTGTVYWTMRCQVTHSLSHSHKPASPLPSVPFAMFAKRHLALQAWREDLWPFKQTQALNGLSVCAAVGQNFLYVVHVCAPVCEHMFVFFMYGHNYCWILLHMRPTCAC